MSAQPEFLAGTKLIGDDYLGDDLRAWFEDEINAFRELPYEDATSDAYFYHALNVRHGFRHLPQVHDASVIGLGSGFGAEFDPIASRIGRLTIVEPGEAPRRDEKRFAVSTIPAAWSGVLELPSDSFDLAVSFGALHHIANVSFVISELARVLKPGGFLLIREPIVSMGDWTRPRKGLTKRERGIPEHLMLDAVRRAGLELVSRAPCIFPAVSLLGRLGIAPYNNPACCVLDDVASRLMHWNVEYHRKHWYQKVSPSSLFLVGRKPARASGE